MRRSVHLPNVTRKRFKKHFLASVHSAIRFNEIEIQTIFDKKDELVSFAAELGFTDAKDLLHGSVTLQQEADKPPVVSQQSSPIGFLFTNPTLKSEIRIEQDKVVYAEFGYLGFEEFKKSFQLYFSEILGILGLDCNLQFNKVGLRKINSVMIQPVSSMQNALSIFNASLFSVPRSGLLNFDAFKAHEEVTVLDQMEDELSVLRVKLIKSQSDTLEASIDFDFVSVQSDLTLERVFDEVLPALNQDHFDAFMWSVTEELITVMETDDA